MNDRIRELAEMAGYRPLPGFEFANSLQEDLLEKFAELIVKECCDWIEGSPSTESGQLLLTKSFIIANLKGLNCDLS